MLSHVMQECCGVLEDDEEWQMIGRHENEKEKEEPKL